MRKLNPCFTIEEIKQYAIENPASLTMLYNKVKEFYTQVRAFIPEAVVCYEISVGVGDKLYIRDACVVFEMHQYIFRIREGEYVTGRKYYEVQTDISDLECIDNTIYSIGYHLNKPADKTRLDLKRIHAWVFHLIKVRKRLEMENEKNRIKKDIILASLSEQPDIVWNDKGDSGYIVRNGIRYMFESKTTFIEERIRVDIPPQTASLRSFLLLSDNKFKNTM